MAGPQGVLQDLQGPFEKYESLGSQSKRAWGRLKWGSNDIAELRARLTSTTVLLTAFLGSLFSTRTFTMELILAFSTSQVVVERKLKNGSREKSTTFRTSEPGILDILLPITNLRSKSSKSNHLIPDITRHQ